MEVSFLKKLEENRAENVLNRKFTADAPNVIRDKNNNALVFDTVDKALPGNSGAQPLFHRDRRFQYANRAFHTKLIHAGITRNLPAS